MNLNRISMPSLSSAVFCLFLMTACGGESTQAQCQKVGTIINGLGAVSPSEMETMVKLGMSAADDLDALELGDKKLSNLRSHLSKSLRLSAEATSTVIDVAGPEGVFDDSAEIEPLITEMSETSQDFQAKIQATQTYCNGGTVSDELTSKPAS